MSVVGNAIVMDDTKISSHSRIVDSVVGERCTLADHTSTTTAGGLLEIEGVPTRSEMGVILGDNVKSGAFTLFKNCIIGNNVSLEGFCDVHNRNIPDNTLVI